MKALIGSIRKNPIVSYYIMVFTISWGGMLLLIGGPGNIPGTKAAVDALMFPALLIMFAGPSVSGLVMNIIVSGKKGLTDYVSRLFKWRVGLSWWAAAVLFAPIILLVVLLPLSLFSSDFIPGLVTSQNRIALLIFGVAWGMIGGGLLEETGWTGFAVPKLRERYSIIKTGLIVGVLWGVWHFLIAFWAGAVMSAGNSFAVFIGGFLLFYIFTLPAYRVLLVSIFEKTGSLLVTMLMHASMSASGIILQPAAIGSPYLIWNAILAVAAWGVVWCWIKGRR